ncbi:hypothetical protein [uncultured Anaerovibrio sp.]|nr:hypothetical protein [uncultured Anaerovibrio sp.]
MTDLNMLFSMVGVFAAAAAIPCVLAPKAALGEVKGLVKSFL